MNAVTETMTHPLVFTEAAAVMPNGRISPEDLGVWSEKHFEPLARITHFMAGQGAVAGIQLAHAGRKASTYRPFPGEPHGEVKPEDGGWQVVAPSAVAIRKACDKDKRSRLSMICWQRAALPVPLRNCCAWQARRSTARYS